MYIAVLPYYTYRKTFAVRIEKMEELYTTHNVAIGTCIYVVAMYSLGEQLCYRMWIQSSS